MNLQRFFTSAFGTRLWLALGGIPPSIAHPVARAGASLVHRRRRSSLYRILYDNQSVVLGHDADPVEADAAVGAVLRHAAMAAYDLARVLAGGEEAIRGALELRDDFWANIEAARATGRGIIMCGAHLSNFNLGFLAFGLYGGLSTQVLSATMTGGGFRVMSDLRNRGGFEETPVDGPALRKAIERLRAGGATAIGVDWPAGEHVGPLTPFFGRPARLPTGYIRMATSTNAVLLPLACRWIPGRGYVSLTAPHLDLELTGDRQRDIAHNARRVLSIIEGWIRETPDQWLMYHRVWPQETSAEEGDHE